MSLVPILDHSMPCQVCTRATDGLSLHTLEFASYKRTLPEHHARTRSAYLIAEDTNFLIQQLIR
jgi:hypothetical protein